MMGVVLSICTVIWTGIIATVILGPIVGIYCQTPRTDYYYYYGYSYVPYYYYRTLTKFFCSHTLSYFLVCPSPFLPS